MALYQQAKNNAMGAVDSLARFLRLVAVARLQANAQPFSLAAHSMGVHLLQYSLALDATREALGSAFNIALVAGCARASGHKDWVPLLRPKGRVFITYNQNDTTLAGATVADGGQVKLGMAPDLTGCAAARCATCASAARRSTPVATPTSPGTSCPSARARCSPGSSARKPTSATMRSRARSTPRAATRTG
ncbi:MAG: hypothetical protein HZY78_09350 [Burkholderiaceae bacterium]|nr:MAG: hypothetical protein HZY78_09350 [Burkholderiaceae bacterium]